MKQLILPTKFGILVDHHSLHKVSSSEYETMKYHNSKGTRACASDKLCRNWNFYIAKVSTSVPLREELKR